MQAPGFTEDLTPVRPKPPNGVDPKPSPFTSLHIAFWTNIEPELTILIDAPDPADPVDPTSTYVLTLCLLLGFGIRDTGWGAKEFVPSPPYLSALRHCTKIEASVHVMYWFVGNPAQGRRLLDITKTFF